MSNVMNKNYIDSTFLTKTTGPVLANSIQTKSNKSYVDNNFLTKQVGAAFAYSIQNKADIDDVMALDGRNPMNANLNMNEYKITNLSSPVDDSDAINKEFMEKFINDGHKSSNRKNEFKYVMDNPNSNISEEDDISIGNLVDYNNSPHNINKKCIKS